MICISFFIFVSSINTRQERRRAAWVDDDRALHVSFSLTRRNWALIVDERRMETADRVGRDQAD